MTRDETIDKNIDETIDKNKVDRPERRIETILEMKV